MQRDLRRLEADRIRAATSRLTDDFLTADQVSKGRQPDTRPFARPPPAPTPPARPKSSPIVRATTPVQRLTRRPTSACQFSRLGAASSVCPYFPCNLRSASQASFASAFDADETDTIWESEDEEGEEEEEEDEETFDVGAKRNTRAILTTPLDRARSLRQRMEEWRHFHKQTAPPPRETRYGKAFPVRKVLKAARPSSII